MQRSKFREPQLHNIPHYEDVRNIPINSNSFVIQDSERRCTDVFCIIIGLTLTIVLAVFAIATYNRAQYLKQVFPADTDGTTCGYEYPGFSYIYFAKPTEMKNRFCVRSCPSTADKPLSCKKTSKLNCDFGSTVTYYPNEAVSNEYGQFCLPKNEGQRKQLMDQMRSYTRDVYYHSVNTIGKCLGIVALVSLLYMFFVQCCPMIMNRVAVVVGAIALVALTVTILVYPSQASPMTRWITFAIALLFVMILVCTFAKYFQTWGMNGVYLYFATKFTGERIYPFVLPVIFLAMGVAFYYFQALQYRSFWSFGQLRFDPEVDLYHKVINPTQHIILTIFQVIQIIWGTMFLKEAFNYLISAEAVQWYYKKPSNLGNAAFTLVCKHIGSVIACAFMNGFFGIADFIFDSLIPPFDESNGCYKCINRFAGFFDLARSDAMTVVYASGNAYCSSARYCEYLACKKSNTDYSQSASRIYRYCAHFALSGIISLVAFWIFGLTAELSIPAMIVLLFMSMGVATFFISLHADAGEAILILYLMELEFIENRRTSKPTDRFNEINHEFNQYLNTSGMKERHPL